MLIEECNLQVSFLKEENERLHIGVSLPPVSVVFGFIPVAINIVAPSTLLRRCARWKI